MRLEIVAIPTIGVLLPLAGFIALLWFIPNDLPNNLTTTIRIIASILVMAGIIWGWKKRMNQNLDK